MNANPQLVIRFALAFILLPAVPACSTTPTAPVEAAPARIPGASLPLAVVRHVEIAYLSPTGRENALKAGASEAVLRQVTEAVEQELAANGYRASALPLSVGGAPMPHASPTGPSDLLTKTGYTEEGLIYEVARHAGDDTLPEALGPTLAWIREQSGADRALLVHVRRDYDSGGMIALRSGMVVLGIALAPFVGPGLVGTAAQASGQRSADVYLVDLHSHRILWQQHLTRGIWDIRDASGARRTAQKLLEGLPPPIAAPDRQGQGASALVTE